MSNRIRMWGKRGSSCCQAVLWAADELDLEVELIPTGGGHGGLGTPEYVALNPNKVVPTIDDNGLVLWESAAILMYLASTYGKGTLYPSDDRARGDAYRWVVWQQTTLRNRLMPLHLEWNLLTDPMSRHLDELEEKRLGLKRLWEAVERQLDGRQHLVGDSFTMADIPIAIMAHWWYRMPIDHFALPNTRAWYERVASRLAFQRQVSG
jgi:glutathione S-transferase